MHRYLMILGGLLALVIAEPVPGKPIYSPIASFVDYAARQTLHGHCYRAFNASALINNLPFSLASLL